MVLLIFISHAIKAQSARDREKYIRDSIYKENIKKTRIYGVHIPKNLEEAFRELDELSEEKDRRKFQMADEKIVAKKLHFGLGRWMSHNWQFEFGSRFTVYLNKLGLYHPDDMIQFMLISYHRYLNKRPLDSEILAKELIEKRKKEEEERIKQNSETISTIRVIKKDSIR